MIQDLNDLSVLGKNNPTNLITIAFDLKILDDAAQLSKELATLLATAQAESDYSAIKTIRDQAFTLLKKAVDEICEFGQYVFWQNDDRKKGYSSSHLRRIRKKRSKNNESVNINENVIKKAE